MRHEDPLIRLCNFTFIFGVILILLSRCAQAADGVEVPVLYPKTASTFEIRKETLDVAEHVFLCTRTDNHWKATKPDAEPTDMREYACLATYTRTDGVGGKYVGTLLYAFPFETET